MPDTVSDPQPDPSIEAIIDDILRERESREGEMDEAWDQRSREELREYFASPYGQKQLADYHGFRKKFKFLYDSGVPIFTKAGILEVLNQIRAHERGEGGKLKITGIDGVAFETEWPATWHDNESDCEDSPEVETFWDKTIICYHTYECLYTFSRVEEFNLETAFLPFLIGHTIEKRNRKTKIPLGQPPTPVRTEDVQRDLEAAIESWRSEEHYEKFCEVAKSARASMPPGVTKVVAFSLGTMTNKYEPYERGTRSLRQHAMLLTITELLASEEGVKYFVQDPAYDEADKKVLEGYGISVLDDPMGFLELDENTIVLSISSNVPVRAISMDISKPAAMIWEAQGYTAAEIRVTDPESPRVTKTLQDEYEKFTLPGHKDLGKLAVFVRKEKNMKTE